MNKLKEAYVAWLSTPHDSVEYKSARKLYTDALYEAHGIEPGNYKAMYPRCSHCSADMPNDNLDPERIATIGVGFYYARAAICPACVVRHFMGSAMYSMSYGGTGDLVWLGRMNEASALATESRRTNEIRETIASLIKELELLGAAHNNK